MARVNNLSNFLTDVASAIKTKKGSETAIPAANFDTEILALPSQGVYQTKVITINENGQTVITPDTGYDAMDGVQVTTNVPEKQLQTKSYNFTTNQTIELSPDTGYDGFDSVVLTINVPVGEDLSAELTEQEEIIARLKTELENKAGKPAKPNIFCQSTEPSKKEGIWLQTDKSYSKLISVPYLATVGEKDTSYRPEIPSPSANYKYNYSIAYNDNIFLFNSDKIYKYDIENNTIEIIQNISNTKAYYTSYCNLNEYVYWFVNGTSNYYKYNMATNELNYYSSGTSVDASHITITDDGLDFIFIGTSTGSGSGSIQKYNIANKTVTSMGNLPSRFYFGRCVTVGDCIYCFGGGNVSASYRYHYKTGVIDTLTDIPRISGQTQSSTHEIAVSTEKIFITINHVTYIYNIATDSYEENITDAYPYFGSPCYYKGRLYGFYNKTISAYVYSISGYEDKSLIISQGNLRYSTQLFDSDSFDGRFLYRFADAWFYTTENGLDNTIPTYYGDGTQWVKFKN